ncbi:glycosyltransferase 87 family protein [Microbispora sp. NPDC049125]|uniref:glycosyltransferase 87 family protein n=1 Tax=Microbispora sp. NPDC049125 TaxID=3154929 RepID=UPI0034675BDE
MTTGPTPEARTPAWAWVLALLAVAAAAAPLIAYWLTNPQDQRLVDLDVYRTGGSALLLGLPVYDVITPAPQLLPFTYPPVAAMLAVPLGAMWWPVAQWVWTAALLAALAATVACAFRPLLDGARTGRLSGSGRMGRRAASARLGEGASTAEPESHGALGRLGKSGVLGRFGVPGWLGSLGRLGVLGRLGGVAAPLVFAVVTIACTYLMPIRDQFRFGQVDIFLVALCLADCLARRPWWPRGMLIGLATAVKLTPGVFLIYLAVTGFSRRDGDPQQRRTFFMAAYTAMLLTLLPFLVIPGDARDFWFGALLDSERLGANAATTNQSLRGMLLRLYLPEWLTSLLWLAAVAVIGWYGFRLARRAFLRGDTTTAVALTGLMAVLLSPVAWIHHLAWMVIVIAAIAGSGRDRLRLLVAAGVWLYYVLPIPWWGVALKALEIPVLSPVAGKIVQNAFGLGAIALVWLLGSWLPRRSATPAP